MSQNMNWRLLSISKYESRIKTALAWFSGKYMFGKSLDGYKTFLKNLHRSFPEHHLVLLYDVSKPLASSKKCTLFVYISLMESPYGERYSALKKNIPLLRYNTEH